MSINRGLLAIGYELHESRGKTSNSRRRINLDPTTVSVLAAWRTWQSAEHAAVGVHDPGWAFADAHGPTDSSARVLADLQADRPSAMVPVIRLHDLRHTHGTLLIKAGVPAKVVSERLGHAKSTFTIETYQHVLPGMQADAARIHENLIAPRVLPEPGSTGPARLNVRANTA
jgi:integrase